MHCTFNFFVRRRVVWLWGIFEDIAISFLFAFGLWGPSWFISIPYSFFFLSLASVQFTRHLGGYFYLGHVFLFSIFFYFYIFILIFFLFLFFYPFIFHLYLENEKLRSDSVALRTIGRGEHLNTCMFKPISMIDMSSCIELPIQPCSVEIDIQMKCKLNQVFSIAASIQ